MGPSRRPRSGLGLGLCLLYLLAAASGADELRPTQALARPLSALVKCTDAQGAGCGEDGSPLALGSAAASAGWHDLDLSQQQRALLQSGYGGAAGYGGGGSTLGYGGVSSDGGASLDTKPTQTQSDAFLGSCAVGAGGVPLSAACSSSGPQLRDLAAVLSLSPQLWSPADATALDQLCDGGCAGELASRFGDYAHTLANASSPTAPRCASALVPNLPPLASLLATSICLSPPAETQQGTCAPAVALALQNTTLLPLLLGLPPSVGQPLRDGHGGVAALGAATPQLCAALAGTGCCGASALQALHAAAQMSCRPKLASAILKLSGTCGLTLPPSCPAFSLPVYETATICQPAKWPNKGCPLPLQGACPATACELACAAVRPGDDASAAAVAADWPAGKSQQDDAPAAATYVSACLEGAAGAPLSPACAATYPDVQALLSLALNTPSQFGPGDAAALKQLCAPRGGAAPCMDQLSTLADSFLAGVKVGGGTCEARLAPNLQPLTSAALGFACLSSDERGASGGEETTTEAEQAQQQPFWASWGTWGEGPQTWCLPAAASALASAGLSGLLSSPWSQSGAAIVNATPALCAGFAAQGAGCCGPSALLTLQLGYQALCMTDVADALGAAVHTCAAPPYLLAGAVCPSFHLPPLAHAQANCSALVLDWVPSSCGISPGTCPSTACQMLCAVATNDPPGGRFFRHPIPSGKDDLEASALFFHMGSADDSNGTTPVVKTATATPAAPGSKDVAAAAYLTGCLNGNSSYDDQITAACQRSYSQLERLLGELWHTPMVADAADVLELQAMCMKPANTFRGEASQPSCMSYYRKSAISYLGNLAVPSPPPPPPPPSPSPPPPPHPSPPPFSPPPPPPSPSPHPRAPNAPNTPVAQSTARRLAAAPPVPTGMVSQQSSFGFWADSPNGGFWNQEAAAPMPSMAPMVPAPAQPPPGAAACDASISAPVAEQLVGVASALVCATDEDSGLPCLPTVSAALASAGLWGPSALSNPAALNATSFCSTLSGLGCCGSTVLNVALNFLGAACHPQHFALAALAKSCNLQQPCNDFVPPPPLRKRPLEPPLGCRPLTMPSNHECAALHQNGATCPTTPCSLLCAIVTLDPPPNTRGGSGVKTGPGGSADSACGGNGCAQVTFGSGGSFTAQSIAAAEARAKLTSAANRLCIALSVVVLLSLGVATWGYRHRGVALASSVDGVSGPSPLLGGLHWAGVLAAALGFAANACVLSTAAPVLCSAAGRMPLPLPLRAAGVVLAYGSLGLYVLSSSQLAQTQHGSLCREGMYASVRHPQLLASLLAALGALVGTASLAAAPGVATVWLVSAWAALHSEETELRRAHGAKWEAWASVTPALFPRISAVPPASEQLQPLMQL